MARGKDFSGFIANSFVRTPVQPAGSIAQMVLTNNNIPFRNVGGSSLPGYDIKSQDCLAMIKLSLLGDGSSNDEGFPEIYCSRDGVAVTVVAGKDATNTGLKDCFLKTESANFVNKIDHVLVKGKDPLPYRFNKDPIDVMGNGNPISFSFSCPTGYPTKNAALAQEAWAEFERSMQSKETQDLLKAAVRRSQWENLVGYKVTFAPVPSYVSISPSQTCPRIMDVPFTSQFNTVMTIPIGDNLPDQGGIVDISGLNGVGAQVLDLVRGPDLLTAFPQLAEDNSYDFSDPDTYFCLLDHECGLVSISRGTNWFLVPAGGNNAGIILRRGGSSRDANQVFNGFATVVNYFRREDGSIESITDMLNANFSNTGELLPAIGGSARANPFRGEIVAGLGGSVGLELTTLQLSYSISKPSIQVKSPQGDAGVHAANLASRGVLYYPIVVTDTPAATGWNGKIVYPVAPPDEEGQAYDVDSEIDELEGTVLDISAPYCGAEGAAGLSSRIFSLINGDSGQYFSLSYRAGGYNLLPGMRLPEGVIQTIEFNYNDGDIMSTNITTGPLYYPVGSYGDSQYVKRAESFSRDGWVVAGSNADGTFIVNVDGLGRYEAINGELQTIYPGDKVEVRLMNVPVELD